MGPTPKEMVIRFLEGLGVHFREVEDSVLYVTFEELREEQGLREAPFTSYLGILPDQRTIVGRASTHWASIIHEAGHLLCEPTVLDRKAQEFDWFGWEWGVVQHLGLPCDEFLAANSDYSISWTTPEGRWVEDVRDLRADETAVFFDVKVGEAKRLGLLTPEGQPTAHPKRLPKLSACLV